MAFPLACRLDGRTLARELLVACLASLPLALAVDRGHLALPALALSLVDALLHAQRGRRMTPRLLAARHAVFGPICILGLALADARAEAVIVALSFTLLCIAARASLRSTLPLLAGCSLLALTVRPSPAPGPDTLRVATYNLRSFAVDVGDLAETIRVLDADVVAIQELGDNIEGRPVDIEGQLRSSLGMLSASALVPHNLHGGFGVGVLSRYPIRSVERLRLPYVPRSENPRDALKVSIDVDGRPVTVVSAHLDRPPYATIADSTSQIQALADWIAEDDAVVLCGDFNAFPVFPGHGLLEATMADARTTQRWPSGSWPRPLGVVRMDWIFARGLTPLSQRVVRRGPSDHFPVVADLAMPSAVAR